jgi:hypothetical protein
MISFRQKGDFSKLTRFLKEQKRPFVLEILTSMVEKE